MAVKPFISRSRKPHAARKLYGPRCSIPQLLPIKVLHCGNRDKWPIWLLWPWLYDLHIRTWPVSPGDISRISENERPTSRLSEVIVWQTDTNEIIYHDASWVVNQKQQRLATVREFTRWTKQIKAADTLQRLITDNQCALIFRTSLYRTACASFYRRLL